MLQALKLAEQAAEIGEVPIGAVIVSADGQIIGRGFNQVESKKCQMFHAESNAIKDACEQLSDWRLDGCTIYVTLEPCLACLGSIILSRIDRLVYGANSKEFGYRKAGFSVEEYANKKIKNIRKNVLKNESELLLKNFFEEQRNK